MTDRNYLTAPPAISLEHCARLFALVLALFISNPCSAQEVGPSTLAFHLEGAEGRVFAPFTRLWPGTAASGTVTIPLDLADPAKVPKELQVELDNLRYRDTKVELPSVTRTALAGKPLAGQLPITINVSSLTASGLFELPVRLYEPGLPPQHFTIALSAKDDPWVPALTILIGVALSFWLRHLAERYEPRQRLLARIHETRGELANLRALTTAADKAQLLDEQLEKLRIVEIRSETEEFNQLNTEFDSVAGELDKQVRERAKKMVELDQRLRQYLTVLGHEQSGVDPPPTDAEKQPFADLRSQLDSIGQSIRRRMLDQAEDHLGEWTEKFKNLRLERQRRLLQIIEARQAAAAAVDPQAAAVDPQKWDSLRSEIRRSLRDGDPDKSVEPLRMLSDLVTAHLPEVPAELQRVAGRQGPEPEQAEGVPPPIAAGRQRATTARTRAGYARYAVQAASVVFATVTGIMALYLGKPFGTGVDYLIAGFWGFGSDSAVKSADDMLKRLRGMSS
jgi:hypothetical protein